MSNVYKRSNLSIFSSFRSIRKQYISDSVSKSLLFPILTLSCKRNIEIDQCSDIQCLDSLFCTIFDSRLVIRCCHGMANKASNNFKTAWRRLLAFKQKFTQKHPQPQDFRKDSLPLHSIHCHKFIPSAFPPPILLPIHLLKPQRILSALLLTTYTLLLLSSFIHLFTLGVSSIGNTSDRCADGGEAFIQGIAHGVA